MSTLEEFAPKDRTTLARWGTEAFRHAYLKTLDRLLKSKKYETRRAYVPAIKQFFTIHRWISPKDITITHAAQYKETLLSKGKKETTTLWRIAAMSSYMKLLSKTKGPDGKFLVNGNPFRQISRDDINPEAFKTNTAVPIKELLKMLQTKPHDVRGLRDRAILAFILFAKANRNELSNLRIQDLNIEELTVILRCSQRERTIELPNVVYQAIREYWLASGRQLKPAHGVFTAIFPKYMQKRFRKNINDPLGHENIRKILKKASRRANSNCDGRTVRVAKKVRDLKKLTAVMNRYSSSSTHLPQQYDKISKAIPEKQLVDAYTRLMEIDRLT